MRILWLKEEYVNSKIFHGVMLGRRRGNTISSVLVKRERIEVVNNVREVVYTHFETHFRSVHM